MRSLNILICSLAVGVLGASAWAQPQPDSGQGQGQNRPRPPRGDQGGRPQELSAEKAKAAWELEATAVSQQIGLNDSQTAAVVKAYSNARTSYAAASEKLRKDMQAKRDAAGDGDNGNSRGEAMKAMNDLTTAEKGKLQAALASSLTPDQVTKAVEPLGTFNPGWDRMVDQISGYKLTAANQQTALKAIQDYVVSTGKARASMQGGGGDRDAMRTAMQDAQQKLNDSLKKVLSADQMTKFDSVMPRGRGGRGGGGGGGGGGQGGGNGNNNGGNQPD